MRLKLTNHQRGDTIVEVLIAVAIISFVLAVSYATTSNSAKDTVDAQEHSQALRAVESQLEFLHEKGSTNASNVCFDTNGAEQSSGSAACTVSPYGAGTQPEYNLVITKPSAGPSGYYTVTATWPSVHGNGNSTVGMYYRPPPS
jgi:type II secretory pathway pseudopilin PulG